MLFVYFLCFVNLVSLQCLEWCLAQCKVWINMGIREWRCEWKSPISHHLKITLLRTGCIPFQTFFYWTSILTELSESCHYWERRREQLSQDLSPPTVTFVEVWASSWQAQKSMLLVLRKDNLTSEVLTYTNQTHKDLVGKTENYFTNSYPFSANLAIKEPTLHWESRLQLKEIGFVDCLRGWIKILGTSNHWK